MSSAQNSANASEVLERLGRLSLREQSMEGLLQTITDLATSVMPGHARASATLPVRDRPTTVASTGPLATDLDERQYDRDHGPCLHAARTGELVEITDTRTDPRWPDYTLRAAEHGAPSSLSVPLDIDADGEVTGGLDIYAREPHAVDEDSRAAAMGSAPSAAVAAGNLHAYRTARTRPTTWGPRWRRARSSTGPRASWRSVTRSPLTRRSRPWPRCR